MIQKRRQKSFISSYILELVEEIFRSSAYGYGFSRFLAGRYFYKFLGEADFNFFKNVKFNNDECFLDIGANDGISALTFRLFNTAKIISFEPDDKHLNSLKRVKNKIKNFEFFQQGLSDKEQKKKLFIPSCNGVYIGQLASFIYDEAKNNVQAIITKKNISKDVKIIEKEVECKTIDNLNLKPRAIKIDVEGYEYEVLKGSIETISKFKPILMIEVNQNSIIKILNFFEEKNYQPFIYDKNQNNLKKFNVNEKLKDSYVINLFLLSKQDREKFVN